MTMNIRDCIDLVEGLIRPDPRANPEFRAWFKNSKVIDEHGDPLIVYHGTGNNFKRFNMAIPHFGMHFGNLTQAEARLEHGDPQIMPCYLSIQNPLRMPDMNDWDFGTVVRQLSDQGIKIRPQDTKTNNYTGLEDTRSILRALIRKGYDGIMYANDFEGKGEDSWIIFSGKQARFAI